MNSDNIRKFGFGQNYSPDKIFRLSKFSSDKIFVTSEKFRPFCPTLFCPIRYDKAPFIICADLQCIKENIDECENNPENSSTTKVSEHIPSGFSMSTISSFRSIENKHDVYRCKGCMKTFCEFLREDAVKKISFKKKRAAGIICKCKNLLYLSRKN